MLIVIHVKVYMAALKNKSHAMLRYNFGGSLKHEAEASFSHLKQILTTQDLSEEYSNTIGNNKTIIMCKMTMPS